MPSYTLYTTVKKQCDAFEQLGCKATLAVDSMKKDAAVEITIKASNFNYRIRHNDWSLIPIKLYHLYDALRNIQYAERIRRVSILNDQSVYAHSYSRQ